MRFIIILLLFVSFNVNAQCKEYIIGVNGDTLNCVDMNNKKQGRWVIKVDNLRGERGYEEEGKRARRGSAALPRGADRAECGGFQGQAEIRTGGNDDGIIAPQFQQRAP